MSTHATSTFEIKNWDEQTCSEVDGHVKLTRADVAFSYTGDLEGTSAMQYLMVYRDDATASVIGLERVTGSWAPNLERSSSSTPAATRTALPRGTSRW